MNIIISGLMAAVLVAAPLSVSAFAQGAAQTAALTAVDPTTITVGYRASKLLGSDVVDTAGTVLGTVDDMIITSNDLVPFAVISVGGFLGMGEKHILVNAKDLSVVDNKIVLANGTKESLTALPAYVYAQ